MKPEKLCTQSCFEWSNGHGGFDNDKPGEECGIFAIYGHPNAAEMSYLGLYALQHRGQE